MQYKIVSAKNTYQYNTLEKLEKEVNNLIAQGWKPLGGVSVVKPYATLTDYEAFQAMIKE